MTMTNLTVLRLVGAGIPPYSARGLTQSISPISQSSSMQRTINGRLVDISNPLMRKYGSVVSGNDQQPPAMGNIWPGMVLIVDCISEMSVQGEYPNPENDGSVLGRVYVPGSLRVEDGFTFFRPRLSMMVVSFNIDRDEWGAAIGWSLVLEENEIYTTEPETETEAPSEPTEAPTEPSTGTEAPTEATETEAPTEYPTEPPTATETPSEPTEYPTETTETSELTEGPGYLILEDEGALELEFDGNLLLED